MDEKVTEDFPKELEEILSFIDKNLKPYEEDKDNLGELRKLSEFINLNNYVISEKELTEMIQKSTVLSAILNSILLKGNIRSEQQVIDLTDDDFIALLIGTFYILNSQDNYYDTESLELDEMFLKERGYANLPYPLPDEQVEKLINSYKEGNQKAFEKIIVTNIRFAVHIAKRYIRSGVPLEDLIQSGIEGLIKTIEHYDPKKSKFTTYAAYRIRVNIRKFIQEHRGMSNATYTLSSKIARAIDELIKKLGRHPSVKEISNYLRVDERKIKYVMQEMLNVLSIDAKPLGLYRKQSNTVQEITPDLLEDGKYDEVEEQADKERILKILMSELTEKQKIVISMHFGFGYPRKYKLIEIADILKDSEQNIGAINGFALKKIALNPVIYRLCDYFDSSLNSRRIILSIQEYFTLYPRKRTAIKRIKPIGIKERLLEDGYTEGEIKLALSRLPKEGQELFDKINNSNLSEISEEEFSKYRKKVIKKLKKQLEIIKPKRLKVKSIKNFKSLKNSKIKRLSKKPRYIS